MSGDYEDPANTRPVSLLPIVSKVCERSALSQFRDFLHSNGIIHHSQSGNRKLHSTETALLHYTDELLKNMDDRKISAVVLLDKSKAFDSIRHDLLINKLYKLGVSFAACSWFLSCLSQRMQVVKIEDSLKHLLDSKTLVFLMNAFIFSRLYYCSTVWSNTTKENIKKLHLIQNFACRIVLGLKKYDHIAEGLKYLNWLNVNDRLLVNDLLMVHKCIHDLIPSYLTGKFTQRSNVHGRNTRGSGELDLPFCRLKTGQRSFAFRGAKLYNNLPNEIKQTSDVKTFKAKVCNYLLNL